MFHCLSAIYCAAAGCDNRSFFAYRAVYLIFQIKKAVCPQFFYQLVQHFSFFFLYDYVRINKPVSHSLCKHYTHTAFADCRHPYQHNVFAIHSRFILYLFPISHRLYLHQDFHRYFLYRSSALSLILYSIFSDFSDFSGFSIFPDRHRTV